MVCRSRIRRRTVRSPADRPPHGSAHPPAGREWRAPRRPCPPAWCGPAGPLRRSPHEPRACARRRRAPRARRPRPAPAAPRTPRTARRPARPRRPRRAHRAGPAAGSRRRPQAEPTVDPRWLGRLPSADRTRPPRARTGSAHRRAPRAQRRADLRAPRSRRSRPHPRRSSRCRPRPRVRPRRRRRPPPPRAPRSPPGRGPRRVRTALVVAHVSPAAGGGDLDDRRASALDESEGRQDLPAERVADARPRRLTAERGQEDRHRPLAAVRERAQVGGRGAPGPFEPPADRGRHDRGGVCPLEAVGCDEDRTVPRVDGQHVRQPSSWSTRHSRGALSSRQRWTLVP